MVTLTGETGAEIPKFFAGRSVFITGASGFMGKMAGNDRTQEQDCPGISASCLVYSKDFAVPEFELVLVERLLVTCPDVDRLFLLIRRKKGTSAEERLQQLKDSQAFDVLREKNPKVLDKMAVVAGDITQPRLGVEPQDVDLMRNVSVVFHSAATLKFEEPLAAAVDQNVRPVISIMELCDTMPNVQVFVYVSTAYSNAELRVVEERVYPASRPLAQLLALVEHAPELLAELTPKYIQPKPNTYTFTKAMAEVAVSEHGCNGYPIAIFRPTIVVSSLKHPHPGWVENLNGPSGVVVGAGKGLLHVLHCKPHLRADLLPVDVAIDSLIAVAWETAVTKPSTPTVYNCSTGGSSGDGAPTWREFTESLRRNLRQHPLDAAYWYPCGNAPPNKLVYTVLAFLLQTVPLYLAEYSLKLMGYKSKLSFITINRRLQAMNSVLTFFMTHEWRFPGERLRALRCRLAPADAALFNISPEHIDWKEHNVNFVKGARKYLLKEKDENIPKARQHLRKMFYLHYGCLILSGTLILRLALCNKIAQDFVYRTARLFLNIYGSFVSNLFLNK